MGLEEDWANATPLSGGQATPMNQTGVPSLQQQFDQSAPPPSMGDVAMNAVPKGLANLLNTPVTLSNLIMAGLANLPGMEHFKDAQAAMQTPIPNYPMQAAEKVGLVDPSKNPQTPVQRIVDAAIQTAVGSAVIPGGGAMGAVRNAAVGATSGAAAQTTKEATEGILGDTGSTLLAVAVGAATPFAMKAITDSSKQLLISGTRKQTLKDAQAVGYSVEPSAIRTPSSKLEAVAGKASIAQEAAIRNQQVTNGLAAKALGLPESTQLSPALLDDLKLRVAKPYEEVEALRASQTNLPWFPRYHSQSLVDELKQARQDATVLYKQYYRQPDQGVLKAAEAASATAKSIEGDIDMIASAAGKPKLLEQLQAARLLYARINDVEKALNVGSGNVSAPIIGRMLDQGKPLSGELQIIGRFAQSFPRVAREIEGVPPSGVSGTDAASSAMLAVGGSAAAGNPAGAVAGGAPLLRGPARNKVLSPKYQKDLLAEPAPPTPTGTAAARAGMAVNTQLSNEQQP